MTSRPTLAFLFRPEARRRQVVEGLRQLMGIVCDLERSEITTAEDLDTRCCLDGLERRSSESFKQVRGLLPFSLTGADLEHAAIKAAAKWSLASNAKQHPPVLATCDAEVANRSKPVRLVLLDILSESYLAASPGSVCCYRL